MILGELRMYFFGFDSQIVLHLSLKYRNEMLMGKRTRFMGRIFAILLNYFWITRPCTMMWICFSSMCCVNVMIEDATWLATSPRRSIPRNPTTWPASLLFLLIREKAMENF